MIGALEIRSDLPKTPVGKISKKDLRALEARGHLETSRAAASVTPAAS
ncbi:MAG: hypothetical protein WA633_02585 [Stellaceae bacterium]